LQREARGLKPLTQPGQVLYAEFNLGLDWHRQQ
jgi:hypothetical protein